MTNELYRYQFNENVPFVDVIESLVLSVLAVEFLYGDAAIRLDAAYDIDKESRMCEIDNGTDVGRSIALIFTGYLSRQFGDKMFTLERRQGVVKGTAPMEKDGK